jgi:hypothetical protein
MVAHDRERSFPRRRRQSVGGICEPVEVQCAGQCGADREGDSRGDESGEDVCEPGGGAADHSADPGADEWEDRGAASEVVSVERRGTPDRQPRQERDSGERASSMISGRYR